MSACKIGPKTAKKVAKILPMYYEGAKLKDIAARCDWTVNTLKHNLRIYHKQYGTTSRRAKVSGNIKADAVEIVDRMKSESIKKIAASYGVSSTTLVSTLKRCGVVLNGEKILQRISLDALKHAGWVDIREPTILTIGRIDRFILTPIDRPIK